MVRAYNCGACEHFSVQPVPTDPFLIVCYQLSQDLNLKQNEAQLLMFYFNKSGMPIMQKTIERASEIDVCWSPDGQSLVLACS